MIVLLLLLLLGDHLDDGRGLSSFSSNNCSIRLTAKAVIPADTMIEPIPNITIA
jgi:hypothetical protein